MDEFNRVEAQGFAASELKAAKNAWRQSEEVARSKDQDEATRDNSLSDLPDFSGFVPAEELAIAVAPRRQ
jgi:hypothetical protein